MKYICDDEFEFRVHKKTSITRRQTIQGKNWMQYMSGYLIQKDIWMAKKYMKKINIVNH